MVEHVVEVVEVAPHGVAVVERPGGAVGGEEVLRESRRRARSSRGRPRGRRTYTAGSNTTGAALAAPRRCRPTGRRAAATSPARWLVKNASQSAASRSPRSIMREGSRLRAASRSCACRRLSRQNASQSSLQPLACGVRADEVVLRPAELRLRHAMLRGERHAQAARRLAASSGDKLQPLEHDPRVLVVGARATITRGTRTAPRVRKRREAVGLGGEHRPRARLVHLGEVVAALARGVSPARHSAVWMQPPPTGVDRGDRRTVLARRIR